jgi:hypothetical protein
MFKIGDIVTGKALESVYVKGLQKFPYSITTSEGIFEVIEFVNDTPNHQVPVIEDNIRIKILSHLDKVNKYAQKGKSYAVNSQWFKKVTAKGRKAIERYINIDKLSK